jgi:hypothetical protein
MTRAKCIPPEGPSDEALEAFGRAIARGLHERYPEYDFIVRRRGAPDEQSTGSPPPEDDALAGD